jgi:cytidine deaminase
MSARKRRPGKVGFDPLATVIEHVIAAATRARERAYAPYSKYRVGAAIATESGLIYTGCNVENASFPAGICAERSAIAAMIAAGDRDPIACAIVTGGAPAPPCGMCRQVLVEFAPALAVVSVAGDGRTARGSLAELLPHAFTPERLGA